MASPQVLELCKKGFANKLDGFFFAEAVGREEPEHETRLEGLLCVFCFLQAKGEKSYPRSLI